MLVPRFRLAELLRRLGSQKIEREEMPLAEVVSPCLTVGDLGEHVPPVLAPRAHYGGAPVITAGNFAAAQITSIAPGGCWVDTITMAAVAGTLIRWRIQLGAGALTTAVASIAQNFGGAPCLSLVQLGDQAALALATTFPSVVIAPGVVVTIPRLYLPAGFALYVEATTANVALSWNFNIQEFAFPLN